MQFSTLFRNIKYDYYKFVKIFQKNYSCNNFTILENNVFLNQITFKFLYLLHIGNGNWNDFTQILIELIHLYIPKVH